MKAQTRGHTGVDGADPVLHDFPSGRAQAAGKGHVLSEEDVRLLATEGLDQVWVTELEDGEVGEDDAVCMRPRKWVAAAWRSGWRQGDARICSPRKIAACWWTTSC